MIILHIAFKSYRRVNIQFTNVDAKKPSGPNAPEQRQRYVAETERTRPIFEADDDWRQKMDHLRRPINSPKQWSRIVP